MTEKIQYPPPEARAQMIARRNQLHRDLVEYIVTRSPKEDEARAQLNPIVRQYGFDEVYRMLRKISPRLNASSNPDEDERRLYAEYVDLYRRFGGERPFLTPPEFARLNHERAMLLGREILQGLQLTQAEQHRLDELSDLLLAEPWLWDDLVPENPPKAAIASPAPQSNKVGRNEPCPCGSGRKYKHCHGR
jgi:SEC-C motif